MTVLTFHFILKKETKWARVRSKRRSWLQEAQRIFGGTEHPIEWFWECLTDSVHLSKSSKLVNFIVHKLYISKHSLFRKKVGRKRWREQGKEEGMTNQSKKQIGIGGWNWHLHFCHNHVNCTSQQVYYPSVMFLKSKKCLLFLSSTICKLILPMDLWR